MPHLARIAASIAPSTEEPAVEQLVKQAKEDYESGPLSLLLACVGALARLGHHDFARAAAAIARQLIAPDDDPEFRVLPARAAGTLQHAVAPGMFAALREAVEGEYFEPRQSALEAMVLLGDPRIIESLAGRLGDDYPDLAEDAASALRRVTDCPPFEPAERATFDAWWKKNRRRFPIGTSHRRGRPMDVGGVVEELGEPRRRRSALHELLVVTGARLEVYLL